MNDMAPDAASFLADMPFLEGEPAAHPAVVAAEVIPDATDFLMDGLLAEADVALPDADAEAARPGVVVADFSVEADRVVTQPATAVAEDGIPDATDFLMDGLLAGVDAALADAVAAQPGTVAPDFAAAADLLPPSVALGSAKVDLREGLAGAWGVDRSRTLSARLGFHIGDLRFVVSFDDASELSEMVTAYRLPNVPAWFRGLANLHGNLVPVFDVAAMIGFPVKADKDRMLLVLGHGSMAAGMLVNELPTRIRLESATAIDLPDLPDALKDCVPKAYLHGGDIWLELQYQRLFETAAARLAS